MAMSDGQGEIMAHGGQTWNGERQEHSMGYGSTTAGRGMEFDRRAEIMKDVGEGASAASNTIRGAPPCSERGSTR